jgi:hypothetical protein
MAKDNPTGQLCFLLLVACSSLLFMQHPASAAAAHSAQQAEPAAAETAATAALQALRTLKRVPLAGNPTVMARAFGAVQDARNWNTLATKLSKPGTHTGPVQFQLEIVV